MPASRGWLPTSSRSRSCESTPRSKTRDVASRLVLQVHDEVIVEVPEDEQDGVGPLVIDIMHGAAELDVPLEVNVAWGSTWADAKG